MRTRIHSLLYYRAAALCQSGRHAAAADILTAAMFYARSSNKARTARMLADCHAKSGDHVRAADYAAISVQCAPDSALSRLLRLRTSLCAGDLVTAQAQVCRLPKCADFQVSHLKAAAAEVMEALDASSAAAASHTQNAVGAAASSAAAAPQGQPTSHAPSAAHSGKGISTADVLWQILHDWKHQLSTMLQAVAEPDVPAAQKPGGGGSAALTAALRRHHAPCLATIGAKGDAAAAASQRKRTDGAHDLLQSCCQWAAVGLRSREAISQCCSTMEAQRLTERMSAGMACVCERACEAAAARQDVSRGEKATRDKVSVQTTESSYMCPLQLTVQQATGWTAVDA